MNTTLKVGDWVKFKGTRSMEPRLSMLWGERTREANRYYVEAIMENTCHADVQTLCRIRGVVADGVATVQTIDVPAMMMELDKPWDWTGYDADVAKEKERDGR